MRSENLSEPLREVSRHVGHVETCWDIVAASTMSLQAGAGHVVGKFQQPVLSYRHMCERSPGNLDAQVPALVQDRP